MTGGKYSRFGFLAATAPTRNDNRGPGEPW